MDSQVIILQDYSQTMMKNNFGSLFVIDFVTLLMPSLVSAFLCGMKISCYIFMKVNCKLSH